MAANTLKRVQNIVDVAAAHAVNRVFRALVNDVVPRNASGAPLAEAGGLGSATYRQLHGYFRSLYLELFSDEMYITSTSDSIQFYAKTKQSGNNAGDPLLVWQIDNNIGNVTTDGSDPGQGGLVKSASCGSFSTAVDADITNLEVDLPTKYGRPVLVGLMTDGATAGYVRGVRASGTQGVARSSIVIKSVPEIPTVDGGSMAFGLEDLAGSYNPGDCGMPPGYFWILWNGGRVEPNDYGGDVTWTFRARALPGTNTEIEVENCRLFAKEI